MNHLGTITNSWFTAAPNNGFGTLEGSGPSAFFVSSHAVYTGSPAWDFVNDWQEVLGSYPILAWQVPAVVDTDGDGVPDNVDNCPTVFNPGQEQTGNNVGGPFGDACVHPSVQLPGDLVIGANPIIDAGTTIEEGDPGATPPIPAVVIGDNVQIGANVQIKQSVTVGDNVILGADTILETNVTLGDGVVLGSSVELGEVTIKENVVIGNFVTILDNSVVEKEAMIGNDVSIADFVTIEDLARIGAGAVIETGVTIKKNACVGMSTMMNTTIIGAGSTIEQDVQIGDGEMIDPMLTIIVNVGGACTAP